GYGPRPGDVEKVRAMGLQKYIDLQLTPERIPDAALEQKLAGYTQLQLSSEQLGDLYHAMLNSTQQGQAMRKQQQRLAAQKSDPAAPAAPGGPPDPAAAAKARR